MWYPDVMARLRRHVGAFARHQGGATAVTYVALLVPTMMAVGLAVDGATLYNADSKLQAANDAAALAMGYAVGKGTTTITGLQAVGNPYLLANMGSNSAITAVAVSGEPATNLTGQVLTVTSTATVATAFMAAVGLSTVQISATTSVTTGIDKQLELILSLDNTGSMLTTPSGATTTNFSALQTASQNLVDILFEDQTEHTKVKIGVVPWVTAVNAGITSGDGTSLAERLIDKTTLTAKTWQTYTGTGSCTSSTNSDPVQLYNLSTAQYVPYAAAANSFDSAGDLATEAQTSADWAGCLIERGYASNRDIDDSVASATNGYWKPYYWPDCSRNNDWRTGSSNCPGTGCTKQVSRTGTTSCTQRGPNLACPSPMTPLTNVKADVDTAIRRLHPWRRGGTVGVPGLAWAYRLLSPTFTSTYLSTSQQANGWNTTNLIKAVVFMTDGDTNVQEGSYGGTANGGSCSGAGSTDDDLTAYGFQYENKFGASSNDTLSEQESWVNSRLATLCTTIKAQGVRIYTIVFTSSVSASTKAIYQTCATDTSKYYDAPDQDTLKSAFYAIAYELGQLRITE